MPINVSFNGVATAAKKILASQNGIVVPVKAVYTGLDGLARKVWPVGPKGLLVVTHANTPFFTAYEHNGDDFVKMPGADVPPAANMQMCAISPDGALLSLSAIGTTAPTALVYAINGGAFTRLPILPLVKSSGPLPSGGCAISPDSQNLAFGSDFTDGKRLKTYKRSGNSFSALSSPSGAPTVQMQSVAYAPNNGFMAATTMNSSPSLYIYSKSGDSYSKLPDPAWMPPSGGTCCVFTPDSNGLMVGYSTQLMYYKRSGSAFTQTGSITGNGLYGNRSGIAFTPDGMYMAASTSASPYILLYKISGDTFTKLDNPSVLPAGAATGCVFSSDGNYLFVVHSVTPFITVYKREGDAFTKIQGPSVLPAGNATGCAYWAA